MNRSAWAPCVVPFILFLISAAFVLVGLGYNPATRSVPELIGGTMLVLTALDVLSRTPTAAGRAVLRWLNPAALTESHEAQDNLRIRQLIAILGAIALGAALVWLGILYSVPLFVLLAIRFGARRSWLYSLSVAAVTTFLIWALFTELLGLTLWPGILFGGDW